MRKFTRLVIKGEFTDLNKYINYERMNKFIASSIKKNETERVYWECISQGLKKQTKKIFIVFKWYLANKKKDKDNIAFAKKFILDGLVMAKVLKNDGFDSIEGFLDLFYLSPDNPRVEVELLDSFSEIKYLLTNKK